MYSVLLDSSSLWGPLVMPLIDPESARPQMGQDGPGVFANILCVDPTIGFVFFFFLFFFLLYDWSYLNIILNEQTISISKHKTHLWTMDRTTRL